MSDKKRDAEVITLGSGDLMIKEYTDVMPEYSDFDATTDLLGRIQGGATLEYKGTWYEAKDDTGKVVKTIVTEEEATLKSGILTWNGKTLAQLCSTARVTEENGIRKVKIGVKFCMSRHSIGILLNHKVAGAESNYLGISLIF